MTEAFETIFGHICLERGWATRDQIVACLRDHARSAESGKHHGLPQLLVSRGILTRDQVEAVRGELAGLLETAPYESVRDDDVRLGTLLIKAGHATRESVLEALARQKELSESGKPVPRLGELLLEMGSTTYAAVKDTVETQRHMRASANPAAPVRGRGRARVALIASSVLAAAGLVLYLLLR